MLSLYNQPALFCRIDDIVPFKEWLGNIFKCYRLKN